LFHPDKLFRAAAPVPSFHEAKAAENEAASGFKAKGKQKQESEDERQPVEVSPGRSGFLVKFHQRLKR
jgi:nitric oxide reductase activation protein